MLRRMMMASAATAGADPHWANVSALLHFGSLDANGRFIDSTGRQWNSSSVPGAIIDSSVKKFGIGSLHADAGSGNGLPTTANDPAFDFSGGDFTIEAFVSRGGDDTANYHGIVVSDDTEGTRGWLFYALTSTGYVKFVAWVGSTSYVVVDSILPALNTWLFYAVVRDGNMLRLYRDGVQVDSTAISGTVNASDQPLKVGTLWGSTSLVSNRYWNGHIDELRITKGVCRYPGGTTFAVPTAAFPDG